MLFHIFTFVFTGVVFVTALVTASSCIDIFHLCLWSNEKCNMEPVFSTKRSIPLETNYELCIICQDTSNDQLHN